MKFTEICKIVVQKVTHRGHCITVFDSELKVGKAGITISAFVNMCVKLTFTVLDIFHNTSTQMQELE